MLNKIHDLSKLVDPEILVQVAILGLLEDKGMKVHDVAELAQRTVRDVWYGLQAEKVEERR